MNRGKIRQLMLLSFVQNNKKIYREKLMIPQIIFLFVCVCVIYKVIFMLKHPFWSRQPVFHFHKIWLWFYNNQVISKEFPIIQKYYDTNHITSYSIYDIPEQIEDNITEFIKTNYLQEKFVSYTPNRNAIMTYFKGHNDPVSLMLFRQDNKLKGTLTARPLNMVIKVKDTVNMFTVDYVDYLCVGKDYRKQQISPKLIHTYSIISNTDHINNQIRDSVYLFKREGNTTAYVPLVCYKAVYYDLKYWNDNTRFPKPYDFTKINSSNKKLLTEYLVKNPLENIFDCVITNDLGNLVELIDENIIIPFIIHNNDEIVCVYYFRNGAMFYKDEPVLDCIGSVLFQPEFMEFFELGFLKAVVSLKDVYKYLNIEALGHNHMLIKSINRKYTEINHEWYSYYLFNYVKRPVLSDQIFILN